MTETVKLRKKHTHDGRDYDKGRKLKVDSTTADWLVENGIAERTMTRTAGKTTAKKTNRLNTGERQ